MKIVTHETKIICDNPNSLHGYFAWPSVTRLQDGRLAMVASGFRMAHICPFGKGIICYSEDDGATWTRPLPIIDTPLDDRDCGICTFGENDVIVTSFNNTASQQRNWAEMTHPVHKKTEEEKKYINAYLDYMLANVNEDDYLGSTFVMSHDGGKTFDREVRRLPITNPHGPCRLPDGTLLHVGLLFHAYVNGAKNCTEPTKTIASYQVFPDGSYQKLGEIENTIPGNILEEPHAIVLKNGKVVVHIRVEGNGQFTLYQSESYDLGKTFTEPHKILGDRGGAPAHLLELSDGTLLSVYGYRDLPFGIKAMFSYDGGETWDIDNVIFETDSSEDIGYPCTVELPEGKLLTVYYCKPTHDAPAVIMQTIWSFEKE